MGANPAMFRLKTFGELAISHEAGLFAGAASQRKSLALLAILAAAGERATSRDRLQSLLWPEVEADKAAHRMAQAVYALRRELGEGFLSRGSSDPRLDPKVLPSDVAEFTEALERGDLERAVGLYRGPFLDGFHLGDAPGFERWAEEERTRFAREYAGALGGLATAAERRGDRLAALEWWRRLAAVDRLSARAAMGYMEALSRVGERTEALRYARVYETLLRDELDATPDAVVTALAERLKVEADDEATNAVGEKPGTVGGVSRRIAGRYLVADTLHQGDLASVFLARDLKHGRDVVVKQFTQANEDLPERLAAAARLQHPHIVPIYDTGTADGDMFCVMPFFEGGSLRARMQREGALPVSEALQIVRETAGALDYAHRHGVVHGHLSPENILIEDGHALLADCGVRPVAGSNAKADLQSLGCILYEVLAGEPPDQSLLGDSRLRTIRRSVPQGVDEVVARALAPMAADRFANASDFAVALSAAGVNGVRPVQVPQQEHSIAVLPFINLSVEQNNEYFSDGMTEELINALVKIPDLHVASRTSSFAFKGKGLDVRAIGERLGARTVVEGSVRREGDRLRVTAQLVNAEDGYHLWAETYDRRMADVFAIQEEIAGTIATTLKLRLGAGGKLVRPGTQDLEVYHLYLRGRFFWNQRSPEGLRRSVEYFTQAIELDPAFPLPYTGLADAYHVLCVYGVLRPLHFYPKAKAAALRALELDPTLAEAHTSLAHVAFVYDLDHATAEREFLRALEINPRYAGAHHWYGWLLTVLGRSDEAVAAARRAVELEPLSTIILARGADILSYARQFDEAADLCRRALELDPLFYNALEVTALNEARRGNSEQALAAIQPLRTWPGNQASCTLPWLLTKAGHREEAFRMLSALDLDPDAETVPTGYMAAWLSGAYASLGDIDLGFRWANRLIDERSFGMQFWEVDPGFDPLRSDPRFPIISRRLGLA